MILALGAAGGAYAQDNTSPIETVVVTGLRQSLMSAMKEKQNSTEVVDSIRAQDIGKLPDPNLSDSLARIPGIQLYRYAGEGLYATIRGLLSQNRTEFNGHSYYTPNGANGGGRDYQPDNAQPELVSGIEVYKNPSADHIEGAIGGLINIKTWKPFDFDGLHGVASVKMNYYDLADAARPTAFGLISNRWKTGIGEIGALVAIGYQKTAMRQDVWATNANTWAARPYLSYGKDLNGNGVANTSSNTTADKGDYVMAPQGIFDQEIFGGRERFGLNTAIQWRPSDNWEITFDYDQTRYSYDQRNYSLSGSFAGNSDAISNLVVKAHNNYVNTAAAATNSTLTSGSLVSGYDFVSGTFTVPEKTLSTGSGASVDDPHQKLLSLNAKWNVSDDLEVTADIAYSAAYEVTYSRGVSMTNATPFSIGEDFSGKNMAVSYDQDAISDPANWVYNTFSNSGSHYVDDERSARLDATYKLHSVFTDVKGGFRYAALGYNYNTIGNGMDTYYLRDASGGYVTAASVGDYKSSFSDCFRGQTRCVKNFVSYNSDIEHTWSRIASEFPNAYTYVNGAKVYGIGNTADYYSLGYFGIREKTYAGYASTDFAFDVGVPVDGNLGVRFIQTEGQTRGVKQDATHSVVSGAQYEYAIPTTSSYSYNNILPSLNVTAHLTDELQLRASVSKGITRVPFSNLNDSIAAVALTGYAVGQTVTVNIGNPDLKPQRSSNYDLSLEYYFSDQGYAYISGFYKDVNGFIVNYESYEDLGLRDLNGNATVITRVVRPKNGLGGTIKGVEIGGQTFFDFLPSPFDGLGMQANYTFIDASQEVVLGSVGSYTTVNTAFSNLSKHSYNLVGMYEKYGITARLAWGWRSSYARMQFGGGTPNLPVKTPAYGTLDASLSYDITPDLTLTFDAANITDSAPNRYENGEKSYLVQQYKYDRRYGLALRYKFGD